MVKINSEMFCKALDAAGFRSSGKELCETLASNGLGKDVYVSLHPDNKTVILYDGREIGGQKHFISIRSNGQIFDNFKGFLSGLNTRPSQFISSALLALFGKDQAPENPADKRILAGMFLSSGCYASDTTIACDNFSAIKNEIGKINVNIKELIYNMLGYAKENGSLEVRSEEIEEIIVKYKNELTTAKDTTAENNILNKMLNEILSTHAARVYAVAHKHGEFKEKGYVSVWTEATEHRYPKWHCAYNFSGIGKFDKNIIPQISGVSRPLH